MQSLAKLLAPKKHVIWDWNGTLLNDVKIAVRTISSILADHGLPEIDLATYKKKFGFPVKDFYVRIGFDFEKQDWELVARQFADRFYAGLAECSLHEGAHELLKELRAGNRKQSILSASQEPDLHRQVKGLGLTPLFDHVFGLSDHYAGSKFERGRELIKTSGIAPSETILIGDTDHDLHVGRELGLDVLLLAHGHQDFERLKALHDNVVEL